MTVAEAIAILREMDPLATLCVMARDPDGDSYEDPVDDIVGMGGNVVLTSKGTMP